MLILLNRRKSLCNVRTSVAQDLDPARVSRIPAAHILLAAVHHLGNVIVTALLVSTRRNESRVVTPSVIVLVAVTHRVTVSVHHVTTVIILFANRNLNGDVPRPFPSHAFKIMPSFHWNLAISSWITSGFPLKTLCHCFFLFCSHYKTTFVHYCFVVADSIEFLTIIGATIVASTSFYNSFLWDCHFVCLICRSIPVNR